MKRIYLLITFILLGFLSGCSFFNERDERNICNGVNRNNLIDVEDVYDKEDGKEVTVCGSITAWDYEGNFFIQDDTAGLYVYGNSILNDLVSHSSVGDIVVIKGTKSTNKDLVQLKIDTSSRYEVIDDSAKRIEPVVVKSYFEIVNNKYKLVKLENVDIGINVNNVTKIKDQDENNLVSIYYGPTIGLKENVDVIGVYYSHSDRLDGFVVSDKSDVYVRENLSDADKLKNAKNRLIIPDEVNNEYILPSYYQDVLISWTSSSSAIEVVNSKIIRNDNLETEIDFTLTANLTIGTETPVQKSFDVTLKKVAFWTLTSTEFYYYDGPEFPTDKLNVDFWDGTGGLLKVELNYCTDGDTSSFTLIDEKGRRTTESVRYLVIDTEETNHPDDGAEEWGKPGSVYTCDLLTNASEIYLQSDPVSGARDKYGRLLGFVWADGELVQYNLVSLGLADAKYAYFDGDAEIYADILKARVTEAKQQGIGMWSTLKDPYWDYVNNRKGW